MIGVGLAAEVLLGQRVALNHRAHGPIEHQVALAQDSLQGIEGRGSHARYS